MSNYGKEPDKCKVITKLSAGNCAEKPAGLEGKDWDE